MIDDPELPEIGVIPLEGGKARWSVWAPAARTVNLILDPGGDEKKITMRRSDRGYFDAEADLSLDGQAYAYSLDGEGPRPDPLSRWQDQGVFGPSRVFFPDRLERDLGRWKGIRREEFVIYELHVGTFTSEGTFDAIIPRIESLLELGITCIELMPVGQFPGRWSWGYDGVFPFAPQNTYGGPLGLHRLIGECHRRGMAVFMDVVYNHFGPEGNVFPRFGPYLTDRTKSDWGLAVNYDRSGCDEVRRVILDNVKMWVRDYGVDGLRLDAADQIYDRSPRPILTEIAEVAHREANLRGYPVHVFAETDLNDAPRFLHPESRGGYGLDGHWNDDFHHAAHVVLTGETNGYYSDFAGGATALAKAYERVFVNDGNWSGFRGRRHGTPATEFPGDRFLAFTQNHDQVGNRLKSDRYATSCPPAASRLAAGLLLLAPRLPLIFMGQEYGESNPFPFFCDFSDPELIEAVRKGRKTEFSHFGWEEEPPDPLSHATRDMAVLGWTWDDTFRSGIRKLHHDLLRLRREHASLRDFSHARTELHENNAVLEILRGEGLRIVFNLTDLPQPFPPEWAGHRPSFRSETPEYGGEPHAGDQLQPHEFAIF